VCLPCTCVHIIRKILAWDINYEATFLIKTIIGFNVNDVMKSGTGISTTASATDM
jgi:hypothetical protein